MITLTRPSYYEPARYSEYVGLSTDDKATIDANNADQFYEIDTGKYYRYSAATNEWVEQPQSDGSTSVNLPPITLDYTGYFLSNDGESTHWREIASADFIVNLTDNHDGTYGADKTYVEIKAAYDAHENIAVHIDSSRLPLMNAQFQDGSAGFTFGYTQVTTGGQLVSTRAVNYYHTADTDEWTDADEVGEYVRIDNAVSKSHVDLVRSSGLTIQLQDGVYLLSACDEIHRGVVCAFVCGSITTISALTGLPGWEVVKGAVANSLSINNKSDTAGLSVSVVSIT